MTPHEAVGKYLSERMPDVYGALVTILQTEDETGIDFGEPAATVQRFLGAATFGACQSCFLPVVFYPDGQALTWPRLTPHYCPGRPRELYSKRPEPAPVPSEPKTVPM